MLSGFESGIGKTIAIYENPDNTGSDEQSLVDGNSGDILACCNIEKIDNLIVYM